MSYIWARWCFINEAQHIFLPFCADLVPVWIQVSDLKLWRNLKILSVFLRYVTSFCGIKEECIKRGLGESLDVRIWRLVKEGWHISAKRVLHQQATSMGPRTSNPNWRLQIRFYKVNCETFRLFNNWYMRERAFIDIWRTREVWRERKMRKRCSRRSSGPDDAEESDNDDDSLTFLRAVTTRSGRALQFWFFS